jgi:hypothetical protein
LVDAASVTSKLFGAGNSALFLRDEILFPLDTMCNSNVTTLTALLGLERTTYMKPLNNLEYFMEQYMGGLTDGIIVVRDFFERTNEVALLATNLRFVYVVLVAMLGVGALLLLAGATLAYFRKSPKKFQGFLYAAVTPLFSLALFSTSIVWCAVLLATIVNAGEFSLYDTVVQSDDDAGLFDALNFHEAK